MGTSSVLKDLPYHYESSSFVPAAADNVFSYADDQTRLSSHMNQSSLKMGGGRMRTTLDSGRGQLVGSHISLSGRVFGVELYVEEVVTERVPPRRKAWETIGRPNLLVIGDYRMGFEVIPHLNGSQFRVFIDYALPKEAPFRWLGYLFGKSYAKWCTRQMAEGVAASFGAQVDESSPT
jgi:hypothetical protein